MNRILAAVAALLLPGMTTAQGIDAVLGSVEANNPTLRAHAELTAARRIESRAGNQLQNPSVEYVHSWGERARLGRTGELTLTQSFDFPTAYARRATRAREQSVQFDAEHAAVRQLILFEAQQACIELVALRQQQAVARDRARNARRLAAVYDRLFESGQGNILDRNRAEMELTAAEGALGLLATEMESVLGQLLSLNGGEPVRFVDSTFAPLAPLPVEEEMSRRYEELDPALRAAIARQRAADATIRVRRAEGLPRLEAGYKYEYSTGQRFNGLVVGMSIPLFAGRQPLRQAKAEAGYARAQLESEQQAMRSRLHTLYERAGVLAASLVRYRDLAAQSTRYAALLDRALQAGQTSVVDYMTQQRTLYDLRDQQIALERDLRLVRAQIEQIGL